MDYEKVTVQDCLTVLNDGKVEGFRQRRGPLDALIIKDWLTALAEAYTRMEDIACLDSDICAIGPGWGIHLDTGIDIIAERTGITLKEEPCCREYPYRYSFRYKEVMFYQISRERLFTGVPEDAEKAG